MLCYNEIKKNLLLFPVMYSVYRVFREPRNSNGSFHDCFLHTTLSSSLLETDGAEHDTGCYAPSGRVLLPFRVIVS